MKRHMLTKHSLKVLCLWGLVSQLVVVSTLIIVVIFPPEHVWGASNFGASAQSSQNNRVLNEDSGEILPILVGGSRLLNFDGLSRAAVGDPNVADVVVVSEKELIVNAKSPGQTTLHVWDKNGVKVYCVQVHRDKTSLARKVSELLDLPGVTVKIANETILLEGRVDKAEDKARAEGIARAYSDKVLNFISVTEHQVEEKPKPKPEPELKPKQEPPPLAPIISKAIDDPRIKVSAVNGAVLLEGSVEREKERTRAEAIARLYSERVTNLIEVTESVEKVQSKSLEPKSPAQAPEIQPTLEQLIPEIKQMIGLSEVKIKIARGTLILEGVVDSPRELERAEKIARAYSDKVVNLILVKEPPAKAELPEGVKLASQIKETIGFPEVDVRIANKTAILEGNVRNEDEARRAEEVAKAYVDKVLNFIQVEEKPKPATEPKPAPKPEPPSLALIISREINDPRIKLLAVNGAVLLEGSVEEEKERTRAEAIARLYSDRVTNLIEVAKKASEIPIPAQKSGGEPPASTQEPAEPKEKLPPKSPPIEELVQNLIGIEGVKVSSIEGALLLEGEVPTQNDVARARTIADLFGKKVVNLLQVKNPIQVLLQVQVIEARRNVGRDLGIRWGGVTGQGDIELPSTKMVPSLTPETELLSPQIGLIGEIFAGSALERLSLFRAKLEAAAQQGLVKLLAAPSMLTLSGNEAKFLVGGEIPIFLGQENGNIRFEWKPYGVQLNITPTVDQLGNIDVKVSPEVSSFDWENALLISGWKIPAFKTRRAEAHLTVRDGSTIALGGLIQSEDVKTQDKIPILGDIPIIGALFRSEKFQKQETELLIFVTPRIVKLGETIPPERITSPAKPEGLPREFMNK